MPSKKKSFAKALAESDPPKKEKKKTMKAALKPVVVYDRFIVFRPDADIDEKNFNPFMEVSGSRDFDDGNLGITLGNFKFFS